MSAGVTCPQAKSLRPVASVDVPLSLTIRSIVFRGRGQPLRGAGVGPSGPSGVAVSGVGRRGRTRRTGSTGPHAGRHPDGGPRGATSQQASTPRERAEAVTPLRGTRARRLSKGLILAQNERWRRGLGMQVVRAARPVAQG